MQRSASFPVVNVLSAVFAALCGLYLVGGGLGSRQSADLPYYLLAGLAMLVAAILIRRRSPLTLALYALLLLCTVVWSVWEVGTDFWALAPRLDVWVIFGIWLLVSVYRTLDGPVKTPAIALLVTLIVSGLVLAYAAFDDPQEINGTFSTASGAVTAAPGNAVADGDWPAYGRTQRGTRYSPLKQINAENAKDLQVAWTFRTGDMKRPTDPGEVTDEVTPIKWAICFICARRIRSCSRLTRRPGRKNGASIPS